MSVQATSWVWTQELAPTPKIILMALADCCNEHGECWPGIRFLAKRCSVSERTVQRTLHHFHVTKLISIKTRFAGGGRQTSNDYRLHLGTYPDRLSPAMPGARKADDKMSGAGAPPSVTTVPDTAMAPLEPLNETQQQPLHFPQGLSEVEHTAIGSLLKGLAYPVAQALLDELADALETKVIKTQPLRWFQSLVRRQKDGVFVPTGGVRIAERRQRKNSALTNSENPEASTCTPQEEAREKIAEMKKLVKKR